MSCSTTPTCAPSHARIERDAQGRLLLTVLDTGNGVAVDGQPPCRRRHLPACPRPARTLQLGQTRLRLRLPGEPLAPEKPLPPTAACLALLLALPLCALAARRHWRWRWTPAPMSRPGCRSLVGLPVAVAGWCGLWALLSKVFQHRFDFAGHLRIALPWLLAIEAGDALLPQVAAALAWPGLWQLAAPLQVVLGALWLRAHLAHVLPLHRRTSRRRWPRSRWPAARSRSASSTAAPTATAAPPT